jgi:hypothetical protein
MTVEPRKPVKSSPPPAAATPAAERSYGITIFCLLAQINTRRTFSEEALDAFLKDVLRNGYADNKPGTTVIYPAHTINKLEVTELRENILSQG